MGFYHSRMGFYHKKMRVDKLTHSTSRFRWTGLLFFAVSLPAISVGVCAEGMQNQQLYVIQVDGEGLLQITQQDERCFGSPQWSPDGRKIAADSWLVKHFGAQGYSITRLILMDADGSESQDLGLGAMPSWSPDGTQLVCHTYVPTNQIVVMNVDGKGREQVANHWGSPRWSPQGQWIATLSQGKFGMVDLSTGAETLVRVPRGLAPQLGFSWSPSGRQICFTDPNTTGLNIIEFDAHWKCKNLRSVATNLKCEPASGWSPDGKKIVFTKASSKKSVSQLYVIDLESDAKPVRLAGQPENQANREPSWSPDGQWIAFTSDVPE